MSSGKRRNPLNLSLPPTVKEEPGKDESSSQSDPSEPTLDEQLQSLVLSQPQVERMNEWMTLKKQIGELREDALERICELGHGNGGVVHKMRHTATGLIMARKLVLLEVKLSIRTQILKELEVLHKCNSPYIVGFYGAFTDNKNISICMEYMDGLSLDIVLKKSGRISEKRIGHIAVAVIKGLTYLKEEFRILHRGNLFNS
jgi:predicted Ser/Thr protein kinase